MADKKISQLDEAGALTGSEPIPVVQGGATKRTTPDALATRVSTALGLGTAATADVMTSAADRTAGRIVIVDHIDALITAPQNTIGTPGQPGFGVGIHPGPLPAGFSEMDGTTTPVAANYGNYLYSDGSICCYIPKCYIRIGHASNPTYATYGVNSIDVQPASAFADEAAANGAGYMLPRAFKDGGQTLKGFFVDKYMASPNAAGDAAISVPLGKPLSLTTDGNYTNSLTLGLSGQLHDAVTLARARGTGWHCSAIWQQWLLAILSLAHGQAATTSTYCAWYDAAGTTNFPKGCNNNALGDVSDASILYITAGDAGSASKPLTGSANQPAKVAHNGQLCGVMDLNGTLWEVQLGITSPGSSATSTTQITDGDTYILKESVALHDLLSGWTGGGSGDANNVWGDATHLATLYDAKTGFLPWGSTQGSYYYFGNGSAQVFAADTSGDAYLQTNSGIGQEAGMSGSGTNLFGNDGSYRYNRHNLFPLSGGFWNGAAAAGVFTRSWGSGRTSSGSTHGGFRAAAPAL